ncbi:MAG: TetR family transcriptional regulator [Rhodobacteraceae bacterium]|nr:TetR family transcriptional regulator [Paracoccaceae bacterium]
MDSTAARNILDPSRERLRGAAERLLAEYGVEGVSVRAITSEAGTNMAAINYHYGGKESLVSEVFRDVARRTARRRISQLDLVEAKARAEGRPPTLADVIDAFLTPYVDEADPATGRLLTHLILMHRIRPTTWTREIVADEFDPLALRYVAALGRAAPGLTNAEVHWRYHLMVGAIMIVLTDDSSHSRMRRLSDGACSPDDRAALRRELLSFLVDAFRGGAGATAGEGPSTD